MSQKGSEIHRCLEAIRSIGSEFRLTDMHVHPFEVVFGTGNYAENRRVSGIWSVDDSAYVLPGIDEKDFIPQPIPAKNIPQSMLERFAMMKLRRLYAHTGPRCLGDQMLLSGISRMLLLPVFQLEANADDEMSLLARIFGADSRFIFGYSVPAGTSNQEVEPILMRAIRLWDVRAVKVHPYLSGIDLCHSSGHLRLESILKAAGNAELPVILHTGAGPDRAESSGKTFGLLENLGEVDFNLTRYPIVLAHAGAFGMNIHQVKSSVISLLESLLQRFHHLSMDVSTLSPEIIGLLLSRIDPRRIVFGSDALYELPWKALIKLFVALEKIFGPEAEKQLVRIAGTNSDLILREKGRDRISPSMPSVVGHVSDGIFE